MMKKHAAEEVRKPFLQGSATDGNTLRNSLIFCGVLIPVFFVSFIASATAVFDFVPLRIVINLAVILLVLFILFNNGSSRGAEAVSLGEILYQKQEKGLTFSESERRNCFHPLKGYLIGAIGTIPFLIAAVFLAFNATLQMTESGALPSWMQSYSARSDIGDALVHYTNPEGMMPVDYIRMFVRICIIPFINIVGGSNPSALLLVERMSPLILLLPAAAYGTGYFFGRKIRNRIHTAISESNKKRIRREKKEQKKRANRASHRGPERLN